VSWEAGAPDAGRSGGWRARWPRARGAVGRLGARRPTWAAARPPRRRPRRPWSLRWRLLALLGTLLLAGLCVTGMVTYRALHSYLLQREDLQLDSFARAAARELIGSGTFGPRIGVGNGGGEPFVEAVDQSGNVAAASPASSAGTVLAPPRLPSHLPAVPTTDAGTDPVSDAVYTTVGSTGSGQAPFRVRISPLSSGNLEVPGESLVVATPLTSVSDRARSIRRRACSRSDPQTTSLAMRLS